jgi:hypothetical protein
MRDGELAACSPLGSPGSFGPPPRGLDLARCGQAQEGETTMNSEYQDPFCQSCAMPLMKPEDFGTEANGTRSDDYCAYCYKGGAFVTPNMTMDQMHDFCVAKMGELDVMPPDQASTLLREVMPKLKRWSATK